jgi:ABC-type metal ion transport system substrate-binding protein
MELKDKDQDQIKELKESYEKPKITTYTEEDIMNQYKVVGFSF